MAGLTWTEEEDDLLIRLYGTSDKGYLRRSLSNRTWDSIKLRANRLGLKFYDNSCSHPYVQANLSKLLEEDVVSYYWMGFLGADGCFLENQLKLTLSKKDKNHVCKFCQFINCSNDREQSNNAYGVRIQDSVIVPKIKKKFYLEKAKTYNPPIISWMSDEKFIPFAIGFIDGDGSIRKQTGRNDAQCSIKVHSSWLENLQEISDRVCGLVGVSSNIASINKEGYACLCFSNSKILRYLKVIAVDMSLPFLERKWKRIDENYVSRLELYEQRLPKIKKMLDKGMRQKDIASELGLSRSAVCSTIKKLKGENYGY